MTAVSVARSVVNHAPSDAQKEAGNYKKEHISFQGIPITIENKKGSVRSGIGKSGKWSCVLPADYGYIKRTEGADGDHVDVYVGPDSNSKLVFVVNQMDGGKFDEHKCVLGCGSLKEACNLYCGAFSDGKGRERIGSVEALPMDAFKSWLAGETKRPAKARGIVERALRVIGK